jgi:hypothetical protein
VCPNANATPALASSLHNPYMTALYRTAGARSQEGFFYARDKNMSGWVIWARRKRGAAGGGAGRSWAWGDGGAEIRSLCGSRTRNDFACGNCAGR